MNLKTLVVAALVAGFAFSSYACMTFVAGKKISSTGRVVVGHNEDDWPPLVVRHGMLPARDWPDGTFLPATPGCCAKVPQAAHTLACYWGEVKFPYGDGNADTFLNERGVLVVSDSGGSSTERMDDPSLLTEGGVKFNLRRAVGERATSARDGVRIIGELVEKYGYAPSARIYTVADADEAWLVQVVHGRNYVAVRCPDDAVTIMPNLYTVYELDAFPAADVIASRDLVENAKRKGFWDGKGKFNFAKAYQGSYDYGLGHAFEHPNNTGRFRQAIRLLTGEEWPEGKPFQFSVKPRGKTFSVADMKSILSAHNPPSKAGSHVLESWSICSSTTIESSVCEFAADQRDTTMHVAVGRGCETPYLAFRPFSDPMPPKLDDSATAERRLETHVAPAPQDAWRFRWPAIVPEVSEHAYEPTRRIVLDEGLRVSVVCGEDEKSAAEWVAGKMAAWFGKRPHVRGEVRRGESNAPWHGDEAYELSAKDGALRIDARTMQGVRWAAMTLRQIAQPVRGTLKTTAYEVPEFVVRDRPETAFRAMHLCAFPEVSPTRIERGIRMAAYYKFNHVILESWGVFKSAKHPWYGYADGWLTVAECRRLADMARDLGVTIIPFFNVFGHARAARGKAGKHAALDVSPEHQPLFEPRAGFNWCLSNPEARRVIREIVTELHAAFGKPPYFHLGCDEADPPTCAACCGADYGKLLADHVLALAGHVRALGARPMIWHDKLILSGDPRWKGFEANGSPATVALLDVLPKDVIICDWCYYPPPKDGRYPTLDHFRSKGFTTMTCPWDDVSGIHAQCEYARRNDMGVICTTWNHFTAYSVWSIYTHAAACAWGAKAAESVKVVAAEYSSALRDVFDTHWRQVGWDTPGGGRYSESGFFPDQIGVSIGER